MAGKRSAALGSELQLIQRVIVCRDEWGATRDERNFRGIRGNQAEVAVAEYLPFVALEGKDQPLEDTDQQASWGRNPCFFSSMDLVFIHLKIIKLFLFSIF